MLSSIIIATSLVSLVALVGIFLISKKFDLHNSSLKMLISLAAGALLAVSFLDLLPEAVEGVEHAGGNVQTVFIVTLLTVVLFFILEKILHWHHCRCQHDAHGHKHDESSGRSKKNIIIANLLGDGIHNLTDGFLIATAFMLDFRVGIITTIVVMLHEIPQEISDFGILVYAGLTKQKALAYNLIFALTSVAGGVTFYYFGSHFTQAIPYMAAFAAGNFIYLSVADLIPELHDESDPNQVIKHTACLLIGVALIFVLQIFHPDIH